MSFKKVHWIIPFSPKISFVDKIGNRLYNGPRGTQLLISGTWECYLIRQKKEFYRYDQVKTLEMEGLF
jgi:hypothetical protein